MRSCAENSCSRAARTNDSSKTSERYSSSPPVLSGGPSGGSPRPVMTSPDLRAAGEGWRWDPPGHSAPGGPVRHGSTDGQVAGPLPGDGDGRRDHKVIPSDWVDPHQGKRLAGENAGGARPGGAGASREKTRPSSDSGPGAGSTRRTAGKGRTGQRTAPGGPGRPPSRKGEAAGTGEGARPEGQPRGPEGHTAGRAAAAEEPGTGYAFTDTGVRPVFGRVSSRRMWGRRAPGHSAADGVRGTAETAGRE